MGLIGKVLGLGDAAQAVGQSAARLAEVFTPNRTQEMALSAGAYEAALAEAGAEFSSAGTGRFDRFVNGLNRLPRPLLALGTLGLFIYAMADPAGFSLRMQGLDQVPEPLWWLLGAVVSFYFGAREAHYFRAGRGSASSAPRPAPVPGPEAAALAGDNAALAEWERGRMR